MTNIVRLRSGGAKDPPIADDEIQNRTRRDRDDVCEQRTQVCLSDQQSHEKKISNDGNDAVRETEP
jgi:hypothetical protein